MCSSLQFSLTRELNRFALSELQNNAWNTSAVECSDGRLIGSTRSWNFRPFSSMVPTWMAAFPSEELDNNTAAWLLAVNGAEK